jgi:hypothetical protein
MGRVGPVREGELMTRREKKKKGVWLVYSTTTVLPCRYARFSTGLPLSKLNLTPHSPDSAPLLAEPPDFLPSQP